MGMRDNTCRERILGILKAMAGVQDVDVSLHRARATIVHVPPCSLEDLVGVVVRAGYGVSLNRDGRGRRAPDARIVRTPTGRHDHVAKGHRSSGETGRGDPAMTALKADLKAKDIMTAEPVCVEPATTIRELARVFEENEISGAPVVNQKGALVGIVSKTDLIRRCSEGTIDMPPAYLFEILSEQGEDEEAAEAIPEPLVCVQDFMTEDAVTVGPNTLVAHVARLLLKKRIHRVIVVDEERFPLGIITSMDLLGVFPD
jgi:CBS domain-containing protein